MRMRPKDLIPRPVPGLDPEQVIEMLQSVVVRPEAVAVEDALVAMFQVGPIPEHVPYLVELIQSTEHQRHEDIARALQDIRDPRATEVLLKVAERSLDYLPYDENFALARKCVWALADIGTPKSRQCLKQLENGTCERVAAFAKRRLDQWESERHRKNG